MTRHLDETERIDALDRTLPPARQAHLDACAACRQALIGLRVVWDDVAIDGKDVPEPSPLFWEHFAARVAAAVDDAGSAGTLPWWRGSARAWVGLAAAAALVIAAGVWSSKSTPPAAVLDATFVDSIGESAEWQFMTDVLDTLEADAAHSVLAPSTGGVDAAFAMLTRTEREAFARLLHAELSEGSE